MMRRSGCPMKESDLYPMLNLNPKVSNYPLPRRFQVTQPTVDIKMGRYQEKKHIKIKDIPMVRNLQY